MGPSLLELLEELPGPRAPAGGSAPLVGTVATADAVVTHAGVCAAVLEQPGAYLYAKKDQPQLRYDLGATEEPSCRITPPPGTTRRTDTSTTGSRTPMI